MSVILSSFRARLAATERETAIDALKVTNGGLCAAARLCGLPRSQFRRIILRYSLQSLLKPAPKMTQANRHMGNAAWQALGEM